MRCQEQAQPTRTRSHAHTKRPHARATQGRMPAGTCARALTQKRAEEISEAHPYTKRMVSPPRCPNRHTWPQAACLRPHTSRAPPRPARRTGDITSPQHALQLGDSLAARPAQPPLHPRDIRQAARTPAVIQGNARTPTLALPQAAAPHTQAHVFARTSLAGAGHGGRRGGGHVGATRGRRALNKRESQAPSREATKHAACDRLQGQ